MYNYRMVEFDNILLTDDTGRERYLQDDDASDFLNEIEKAERVKSNISVDQLIQNVISEYFAD